MDRSGYRCLICNGCTKWVNVVNHRFIYCHFCNKYYRLLPGQKLRESSLEEIERIWKEEVWE